MRTALEFVKITISVAIVRTGSEGALIRQKSNTGPEGGECETLAEPPDQGRCEREETHLGGQAARQTGAQVSRA